MALSANMSTIDDLGIDYKALLWKKGNLPLLLSLEKHFSPIKRTLKRLKEVAMSRDKDMIRFMLKGYDVFSESELDMRWLHKMLLLYGDDDDKINLSVLDWDSVFQEIFANADYKLYEKYKNPYHTKITMEQIYNICKLDEKLIEEIFQHIKSNDKMVLCMLNELLCNDKVHLYRRYAKGRTIEYHHLFKNACFAKSDLSLVEEMIDRVDDDVLSANLYFAFINCNAHTCKRIIDRIGVTFDVLKSILLNDRQDLSEFLSIYGTLSTIDISHLLNSTKNPVFITEIMKKGTFNPDKRVLHHMGSVKDARLVMRMVYHAKDIKAAITTVFNSACQNNNVELFGMISDNNIITEDQYKKACEMACEYGHIDIVKRILIKCSLDNTPLLVKACLSGNVALVKFLHELNLPARNLLQNACISGNLETLEYLLGKINSNKQALSKH
jgi:Ankyrin repeats (3 copies)